MFVWYKIFISVFCSRGKFQQRPPEHKLGRQVSLVPAHLRDVIFQVTRRSERYRGKLNLTYAVEGVYVMNNVVLLYDEVGCYHSVSWR